MRINRFVPEQGIYYNLVNNSYKLFGKIKKYFITGTSITLVRDKLQQRRQMQVEASSQPSKVKQQIYTVYKNPDIVEFCRFPADVYIAITPPQKNPHMATLPPYDLSKDPGNTNL